MTTINTPFLQGNRLAHYPARATAPVALFKSLSFSLGQKWVALVGEFGSGTLPTASALMGLLPVPLTIDAALAYPFTARI
ncbi:MAG: hypothetical protein ACTXOO_02160 [Sodalis sp. (in: enterobacteria)]